MYKRSFLAALVVASALGVNLEQGKVVNFLPVTAAQTTTCAEGNSILTSIYTIVNGGTDTSTLNQNKTTAFCNGSDLLLSGAGTGPSCENASTLACGRNMNYEYNSYNAIGSQLGWTSYYSTQDDVQYDTVREQVICAPNNTTTNKYFSTYVRTSGPITDYYNVNQSKTYALCDAGDMAIAGGGANVYCDTAGNGGCANQMLEFNGRIVSGSQEGWSVLYSVPGDAIYDTIQTTVVCMKKTAQFDSALRVYHVVNESPDIYALSQNRTTALCNPGDVAIGGGGNAAFCDNASNPACGKVQYLEINKNVTIGNQQGWQAAFDLGGDAIYDTQRTEVTCIGLSNSCLNPAQCADGVDNDGDGATDFPADFSCSNDTDTDETNPRAQCQDGIDNDGDGLVDMNDPGCGSAQDNTENSNTFQCSDGADNDGDGAVDLNDFSCAGSFDNDETNPRAACQDGVDNDGDGLTDLSDPGCANRQDNDETNACTQNLPATRTFANGGLDAIGFVDQYQPDVWTYVDGTALADDAPTMQKICNLAGYSTVSSYTNKGFSSCGDNFIAHWTGTTFINHQACADGNHWLVNLVCSNPINNCPVTPQCADGVDNDGDGATDLNDFSCSGATDTDETNPRAQCQDGTDNDGDGLVDMNDPGCSNAQDNTENSNTYQCSDGVDNDGDGATDLSDFSCSGTTDNDETNPKSQCQDGIDNDGDGAIDSADFSCANGQDNDEANPKSQCQDGIDNDGDGLTDLSDPGCSNGQDNTENSNTYQCSDSVDNDSDGLVDSNDPGCHSDFNRYNTASYVATGNNEAANSTRGTCANGIDDNANSLIDAQDPICHTDGNASNAASFDSTKNETGTTGGNADLSITKSAPVTAARGGTITYTITVANAGPATAQNVVINDPIPSGLTAANFVTATNCALATSQTAITCQLGSIASGTSQTVSIIFNVPVLQGCNQNATFQNTASVTATNDSNTSNNTSTTVSSTITCGTSGTQCSDGTDNDGDGLIDANDPGCHSDFNRYNSSSYVATGNNEAANSGQGTCANGIDDNGNSLIDAQDPACHTDGNPNNPGTFNPSGNEKFQCQDNIDNDSDSLVDSNDPGCHTDFNRYNSTSYNPNGNNEAANSNGYGTCADGKDNDSDSQIDAQDSDCHTDGNVNNNNSFNPSGNEGSTTNVNPTDLSISFTGPTSVVKGTTVIYTATVTNNGPAIATNIRVTDPPLGFTFLPAQSTQNCAQNGTDVVCTLASLAVGSSQTFTLAFSTNGATCNTYVTDTATVTATNTDPNTTNNQSQTITTFVSCSATGNQCQDGVDNDSDGKIDALDPDCHSDGNVNNSGSFDGTRNESTNNGNCHDDDLTITISDTPDPVDADDEIEYEITLENDCNSARTITVTAELDHDTEFVDATNNGNDIDDQTVRWDNLSIGANDDRTIRLTVRTDRDLEDGDRVRLEVNSGTQSETEDTTIGQGGGSSSSNGTTGLSVTTQADRSEAQPGDVVTYTITVRNNGNTAVSDATLQNNYTSGQLTILDPAGGQINGTSISWNLDRLDPNTSRQLRYTTRIGSSMRNGEVVANTATLTANGRSTSANGIVRIVTQLPQTGVGFGFLTGNTTQGLSPMQIDASSHTDSSSFVTTMAILSTMIGGLGMGGLVGKRYFL